MSVDPADAGLRQGLEAILLVAIEPVPPTVLAELLDVTAAEIQACCAELAAAYRAEGRGFVLAHVAGGYRYQTAPEAAGHVERFVNRGVSARLSTAALETLAIVAYRQPVSRAQIAALRGVNVDGVSRMLEQRGYIEVVGRAEGPGQPVLYGTTALFLERLGLASLSDLPPIETLLPGPEAASAIDHDLAAGSMAGGSMAAGSMALASAAAPTAAPGGAGAEGPATGEA